MPGSNEPYETLHVAANRCGGLRGGRGRRRGVFQGLDVLAVQPPAGGTTITITAAGASPRNLTVPPGTQITFINNDTVAHEMFSDPHPEHTDCPEFDSVGHLAPGATRQTKNLTTIRVCGFHDHINPFVTSLTGSIRIQ